MAAMTVARMRVTGRWAAIPSSCAAEWAPKHGLPYSPASSRNPAGWTCSPWQTACTPGKDSTARAGHLFLTAPAAQKGRLIQYAGRILRPYDGNATAEVHVYHDELTGVLALPLAKRAPGYRSLGFPDPETLL
jgi:hypothetical protein